MVLKISFVVYIMVKNVDQRFPRPKHDVPSVLSLFINQIYSIYWLYGSKETRKHSFQKLESENLWFTFQNYSDWFINCQNSQQVLFVVDSYLSNQIIVAALNTFVFCDKSTELKIPCFDCVNRSSCSGHIHSTIDPTIRAATAAVFTCSWWLFSGWAWPFERSSEPWSSKFIS